MFKIMDGKKYDTETATRIYRYDNGRTYFDFNFYSEALYRKKNGEFFIYGEGGAATCYAVRSGSNNWLGSWDIIPVTADYARKWLETYATGEAYELAFGVTEE